MRTTITLAGLVLLAAGLASPLPAQAVAPTCQGKEATIVQATGAVHGTDGADVIVAGDPDSEASTTVLAGEGDDTVCISAGDLSYDVVDGGVGTDSVEARSPVLSEGSLRIVDFEHLDVKTYFHLSGITLEWTEPPSVLDGAVDASHDPRRTAGKYLDNPTVYLVARGHSVPELRVDLGRGTVSLGKGLGFDLTGTNDVGMTANRLRAFGNESRNYFFLAGCDVVAKGRAANDRLWMEDRKADRNCPGARLFGQHGRDKLRGSDRNDTLIGGKGRDLADGGNGRDRCVAEKEYTCER